MRSRAVALEDLATLPHRPASLAARRDGEGVRWSVFAGEEALVGEASSLQALLESWGERPVIAHDWKETSRATAATLGKEAVRHAAVAPRNLEHDTAVGAYLVNPARRQYPLDELLEEAGIEVPADGEDGLAQEAAAVIRHAARGLKVIEHFEHGRIPSRMLLLPAAPKEKVAAGAVFLEDQTLAGSKAMAGCSATR